MYMERSGQPVFGLDLWRHGDEMRKQEKDRQEQRQALSAYDQWRLMQGEKAISPRVRGSHARDPHRTSPRSLHAERAKRYEEYEAIKRKRALAESVRRSHRTRKREKATKQTLARHAQNTVRRRREARSILSRKLPGDTVGHIDSFLGIDRYPQTEGMRSACRKEREGKGKERKGKGRKGKGKKKDTKRRKKVRKRPARKRRSHRNRRGGMYTQQQSFKSGDRIWYTGKRGEIGDGVREQWNPAVVSEVPSWGNIAHPTHIKLRDGDSHVFANRANIDTTEDSETRRARTRHAAQHLRDRQRGSKRLRIRESSQGEQDRIDANKRKQKAEQRAKEIKAKYGVTLAERDESLKKMLDDGKRRTQKTVSISLG